MTEKFRFFAKRINQFDNNWKHKEIINKLIQDWIMILVEDGSTWPMRTNSLVLSGFLGTKHQGVVSAIKRLERSHGKNILWTLTLSTRKESLQNLDWKLHNKGESKPSFSQQQTSSSWSQLWETSDRQKECPVSAVKFNKTNHIVYIQKIVPNSSDLGQKPSTVEGMSRDQKSSCILTIQLLEINLHS